MSAQLAREGLDRVGSCLSTACAVHCSLKPLLFVLPSFAWLDLVMGPGFESVLLASGVVLATTSVTWGYTRHQNARIVLVLLAAFGLIGLGRLVVACAWMETALVVSGGLLIALTHRVNARLCGCCE